MKNIMMRNKCLHPDFVKWEEKTPKVLIPISLELFISFIILILSFFIIIYLVVIL